MYKISIINGRYYYTNKNTEPYIIYKRSFFIEHKLNFMYLTNKKYTFIGNDAFNELLFNIDLLGQFTDEK